MPTASSPPPRPARRRSVTASSAPTSSRWATPRRAAPGPCCICRSSPCHATAVRPGCRSASRCSAGSALILHCSTWRAGPRMCSAKPLPPLREPEARRLLMSKLLSALLGASLLAVAAPALAGKADDTLNVGFRLQLQSLDAYYSPGREGLLLGFWAYDGLIYRDPTTFEFKPLIATAWRQIDDLTLEFDIRKGVKFHNGATVTAEDVAYTLDFVGKPENKVFNQVSVAWIDTATVVGPDTVRVKAKRVTPIALEYLAQLAIYPAAYYRSVGKEGMATKPVGTGPYKAEPGPNNTGV